MDKIRITLETLYDILRNEKKKEDLQKLEESFFNDVVNYLKEKQSLLLSQKPEKELFAAGEKQKIEYELRSIRRILKEIYEKREKKILEIALNRSRTGSDIIDTSAMLREEKKFYVQLLETLDIYRRGVLLNLFKGELPFVEGRAVVKEVEVKKVVEPEKKDEVEEKEESRLEKEAEIEEAVMIKIKFIHPTPSFVWKDMQVYGPFEIGDETEIFPEVAELLVRKGRAEKV
ncbi:MAG: hypothetical protein KJ597_00900 [Nanoarchaeota archaeon]|nr:hypothetical protein [Nanoarchaeota archaeon]MBU1622109.1 hypothetical protein [Nanoarchaeota archaeon]